MEIEGKIAHPEGGQAHGRSSLNPKEIKNYVFIVVGTATNNEAEALAIYQGIVSIENRGIKQMSQGRLYYYNPPYALRTRYSFSSAHTWVKSTEGEF